MFLFGAFFDLSTLFLYLLPAPTINEIDKFLVPDLHGFAQFRVLLLMLVYRIGIDLLSRLPR